ncbi:MAG: M56 family metallopeptidase [Mediterranea sp.]|jgi:TonB family protein|nr:M56 family metallopeptidase [Mediterranea sp.]
MGFFLAYILKSATILALFYLFYRLLLSRETFHRFNRLALLGILLFATLLPMIKITTVKPMPFSVSVERVFFEAMPLEVAPSVGVSWAVWLLAVYAGGCLFFVIRHCYVLLSLYRLLRRGVKEELGRYILDAPTKVTLLVLDEEVAPFSWRHYIVISRKDLEENGREILTHELAHIRMHHSWDIGVADVCICLQWFNPAAWLLKQELQGIHEYEADDSVIQKGIDAKQYQLLLIKKAVGAKLYSMTNSLNHSKLKKRITMMKKEKSKSWARMKYLYVLPLAVVAVTAFARPEISNRMDEISAVKVNDLKAIINAEVSNVLKDDVPEVLQDTFTVFKGTDIPLTTGDDVVYSVRRIGEGDSQAYEMRLIEDGSVTYQDTTKVKPQFTPQEVDDDPLYDVVDVMPQFMGGDAEFMKYLARNIKYPVEAQKSRTEGRVLVQFVIRRDGSITDAKVVRGINSYLDAEALRVIKAMPKWKPGMSKKGKPVSVKYTVPIMYQLPKK